MNGQNLLKYALALLLIMFFASSCKGQSGEAKDNSVKTDSEKNTKVQAAPTDLPDSTDVELAKANRTARNIKNGYYILVQKSKYLLSLYKDGKLVNSYPVALGKTVGDKIKVADSATPEGHFDVKEIKDASTWVYDFHDGKGDTKGAYGPWFISLNTKRPQTFTGEGWTGIGIHGTHDPTSIGKDISAGCIRLNNEHVLALKKELDKASDITKVQVDILQ